MKAYVQTATGSAGLKAATIDIDTNNGFAVYDPLAGTGGGGNIYNPPPPSLVPGNILSFQDQSFESPGAGRWAIDTGAGGTGSVSWVSSPTYDGGGALQVSIASNGSTVATSPAAPVYAISPNRNYNFSAFIQALTVNDQAFLAFQWWDTNKVFISNFIGTWQNVVTGSFTSLTWTGPSPANAAYVIAYIGFKTSGNTYVIDACVVTDQGSASGGGGTSGGVTLISGNVLSLQDQSFETNNVGTWGVDPGGTGTLSWVSSPTYDGNGAIQVVTSSASMPARTNLYTVTANHNYLMTAHVRPVTATDNVQVLLQWLDSAGAFISNSIGAWNSSLVNVWTASTVIAASPANAVSVRAVIAFQTSGNTYVVDTVSVVDQGAVSTGGGGSGGSSTLNSVARILFCMDGPHQGSLYEVPPGYSWASTPLVDQISNLGNAAVTYWGQVYLSASTNGVVPPSDGSVQIQIANAQLYGWNGSSWVLLGQDAAPTGAWFIADFNNNDSISASISAASVGIDVVSLTGQRDSRGIMYDNFHHFWHARPAIPINTYTNVFSTAQGRLIGSHAGAYSGNTFLMNVAGDWWLNTTIGYGTGNNNPGIGQGRFCWLTTSWQAFNFWGGGAYGGQPDSWLQAHPPPLDGMGIPPN